MKSLTKKQAKLARARIIKPEATLSELGDISGYSSPQKVHRALALPHVQDRMRALMEAHHETNSIGLHKKMREGLNATTIKVFKGEDDELIESEEYVDHNARAKFLGFASTWVGLDEKEERSDVYL